MLTVEKRPYEFLARWNTKTGALQGAHVGFANVVLEDGEFKSESLDNPEAVDVGSGAGFPLADILGDLQVTALADLDRERATAAQMQEDYGAAAASLQDQVASLQDQVASLQDQVASLQAGVESRDQEIAARERSIESLTAELQARDAQISQLMADAASAQSSS